MPRLLDPLAYWHLRSEIAYSRLLQSYWGWRIRAKYNPNQPRLPAGGPGGGQWTDGSGGGEVGARGESTAPDPARVETRRDETGAESWDRVESRYGVDGRLLEQRVVNRDGGTIRTEYSPADAPNLGARHTVVLPSGASVVFEDEGATQTVRDGETGEIVSRSTWTPNGPEPEAVVQQAAHALRRAPPQQPGQQPTPPPINDAVRRGIEAAGALATWLSSQLPGHPVAVVLPARLYEVDTFAEPNLVHVRRLDEEETSELCPRYPDLVARTNAAVTLARGQRENWAPQAFGSRVHKLVADSINGPRAPVESGPHQRRAYENPNYIAEFSYVKVNDDYKDANYGTPGSIRVDVLENAGHGNVCVYDLKTGWRGLSGPRAREIASSVRYHFPATQRIAVIEVRVPRR